MKVKSRHHVYRYVPDFLNNRRLPVEKKSEQIVILLKGISAQDNDDYQRESINNTRTYAPDKAQELNEARFNKMCAEKFEGVENLEIEGLEGKELDFYTFYAEAPQDIVNEALRAMRSTEVLTAGEQKNFLPGSDGRSSAPAVKKTSTTAGSAKKKRG